MSGYDYKTIAAPRRAKKTRAVREKDAQLALTLEEIINEQAAEGWSYLRADTLPVEEKNGFFSRTRHVRRAILVFRREADEQRAEQAALRASPSVPAAPQAAPMRAEPMRAEPMRAEPTRAEPTRAEPMRAEPMRAEPMRAEPTAGAPASDDRPREPFMRMATSSPAGPGYEDRHRAAPEIGGATRDN